MPLTRKRERHIFLNYKMVKAKFQHYLVFDRGLGLADVEFCKPRSNANQSTVNSLYPFNGFRCTFLKSFGLFLNTWHYATGIRSFGKFLLEFPMDSL